MLRGMAHRVLLVEDEAEIASPLVRTLEREGYVVDQATTGRDAILAATTHGHDVDLALFAYAGRTVHAALKRPPWKKKMFGTGNWYPPPTRITSVAADSETRPLEAKKANGGAQ